MNQSYKWSTFPFNQWSLQLTNSYIHSHQQQIYNQFSFLFNLKHAFPEFEHNASMLILIFFIIDMMHSCPYLLLQIYSIHNAARTALYLLSLPAMLYANWSFFNSPCSLCPLLPNKMPHPSNSTLQSQHPLAHHDQLVYLATDTFQKVQAFL